MVSKLQSPIYVQVEITSDCNNRCVYCYNFWRNASEKQKRRDLSPKEWELVAEILGDNGIFYVTVTGGEPFLKKENLYHFLDCLCEQNIRIMVNSNATLVGEIEARELSKYPIDTFLTSLISHDPKMHDQISNNRYSHQKTLVGIKNLQNAGIPIAVNMVATKLNYEQVYATGKWVYENLGILDFSATPICPSVSEHEVLELNKDEVLLTLFQLLRLKKDLGLRVDILEVLPTCLFDDADDREIVEIFSTRMCTAGNTTVTIGSEGDVRVCSYDRKSYGNILEEEFHTIWSRMESWRNNELLPKECCQCEIVDSCGGGCRVNSRVKTGSYCEMSSLAKSAVKKRREEFFSKNTDVPLDRRFRLSEKLMFRGERENFFVVVANPMYFTIVDENGFALLQHLAALESFSPSEVIASLELEKKTAQYFFTELSNKGLLMKVD